VADGSAHDADTIAVSTSGLDRTRTTVGEFLDSHPEFCFDLEEYLLSTQHVQALDRRFQSFVAALASVDTWPSTELMVASVRAGSCDRIPAYRTHRRVSTIAEWPFIDKNIVKGAQPDFLSPEFDSNQLFLRTTTGSSGSPFQVWHSAEFYFDVLLLSLRKAAVVAGATEAFSRPVFALAINDDRATKNFVLADPTDATGLSIRVVVDQRSAETFDRVFALIEELEPACISSKPSIFEVLVDRLAARGTFRGRSPDFVLSSGARLNDTLRSTLGDCFRTRVVDAYGLAEFGVVASECPRGGLHIDASTVYVEILGSQGNLLAEGQPGEIVVSSLTNRAMPLLRYRTRDIGSLETSRCACGSSAPRLTQLSGRIIECFRRPSGRLFNPTYFNDLFVRFPMLKDFQITQETLHHFDVRIEVDASVKDVAETVAAVRAYVESSIPEAPAVTVNPTAFGRDCKFERYRMCL
jgi:phenylacetate-coenzyme A ligase PaaK-like adenylate-forming protein